MYNQFCNAVFHISEHFFYDQTAQAGETTLEHELLEWSKAIYAEELKQNAYLHRIDLQGKTRPSARDDHAAKP